MGKDIKYIFVDLDDTLIKTDLLFETAVLFVKRNPLNVFLLFIWVLSGKAALKDKLSARVDVDETELPYQQVLLDYLIQKKAEGKKLILATASHIRYARAIADHLNIFDDVIASDKDKNLKGKRKLEAISEYAKGEPFAYAGDNRADLVIWENAASNILVNVPPSIADAVEANGKVEKNINTLKRTRLGAFIKGMRVHQWAKNVLILVPLFTSHQYSNLDSLVACVLAFFSFSLCASGVYFFNDLLDVQADRKHKTKCNRPLASGDLSIPMGVVGSILFPVIAFSLAFLLLSPKFVLVLAGYFLVTNAYSFYLKRISTMDVMVLAMLYTFRIIAGSVAIGVVFSSWLMAFSIFVFVSLAYLKRYIEIADADDTEERVSGRGYSSADRETMFMLGTSTITASVLILALYITSEEVVILYKTPDILWLLCMLMLYWGNRIWVGARRGKITDDPVVFAIKDKVSRLIGLAFIGLVLAATFVKI